MEAIPNKKDANAPLTSAEIGRDYCNQLFKIEESLKDLSQKNVNISVLNWKNQFLMPFGAGCFPILQKELMPWSETIREQCGN